MSFSISGSSGRCFTEAFVELQHGRTPGWAFLVVVLGVAGTVFVREGSCCGCLHGRCVQQPRTVLWVYHKQALHLSRGAPEGKARCQVQLFLLAACSVGKAGGTNSEHFVTAAAGGWQLLECAENGFLSVVSMLYSLVHNLSILPNYECQV